MNGASYHQPAAVPLTCCPIHIVRPTSTKRVLTKRVALTEYSIAVAVVYYALGGALR